MVTSDIVRARPIAGLVLRIRLCDEHAAHQPTPDGWSELRLVERHDPPGPVLTMPAPGLWLLPISHAWRDCREKDLAALRRTVATAALDAVADAAPAAVVAEEARLCGLAGVIAARRAGAAFVLHLSTADVEQGLFDDRTLPVLADCLHACAAVVVPDTASAQTLGAHPDAPARILIGAARAHAAIEAIATDARRGTAVPWQRPSSTRLSVSRPVAAGRERFLVGEVLDSGWWGYGPAARSLETLFRDRLRAGGAIAVTSGTAALHLALQGAGVGVGDEVIVPATTFVSTAMAVTHAGGTPRMADVDPCTLALSVRSVAACLTGRTRAVIVVHFAGVPADLAPLHALLAPLGIPLIEDAAHALGARRAGRIVGAGSAFACFSFAATKALAAGGGGLLVFRDAALEPFLRRRSNVGLSEDTLQRHARGDAPGNCVEDIGFRYRMDDITAAVVHAQLERLEEKRGIRAALVARYCRRLRAVPTCQLLAMPDDAEPTWYVFPILVPAARRDALRRLLAERGIDTSVHYPSLSAQPFYRGLGDVTPVADDAARRLISLPLHEGVDDAAVHRICDIVQTSLAGAEEAVSS